MKTIEVAGGKYAIVDDKWYPILAEYKWYMADGYPTTWVDRRPVKMHHMVLPPVPGLVCDHINGIKHDAREENLRNVTLAENAKNRTGVNKNSKTGCRNVHRLKNGRFLVSKMIDGQRTYIGTFDSTTEANDALILYEQTRERQLERLARRPSADELTELLGGN